MFTKNRYGFTLIELLVVLALVGLLSVLAVIALGSARQSARDAVRLANLRDIQGSLELHYINHNSYPVVAEPQILGYGDFACLNADGFGPAGCTNPYMALVHADPEDGLYQYVSEDGVTYRIFATLEGEVNGLSGNIVVGPSQISSVQ